MDKLKLYNRLYGKVYDNPVYDFSVFQPYIDAAIKVKNEPIYCDPVGFSKLIQSSKWPTWAEWEDKKMNKFIRVPADKMNPGGVDWRPKSFIKGTWNVGKSVDVLVESDATHWYSGPQYPHSLTDPLNYGGRTTSSGSHAVYLVTPEVYEEYVKLSTPVPFVTKTATKRVRKSKMSYPVDTHDYKTPLTEGTPGTSVIHVPVGLVAGEDTRPERWVAQRWYNNALKDDWDYKNWNKQTNLMLKNTNHMAKSLRGQSHDSNYKFIKYLVIDSHFKADHKMSPKQWQKKFNPGFVDPNKTTKSKMKTIKFTKKVVSTVKYDSSLQSNFTPNTRCPVPTGTIMWKYGWDVSGGYRGGGLRVIIKLVTLEPGIYSGSGDGKFRVPSAKVVGMWAQSTGKSTKLAFSQHDPSFTYKMGAIVRCKGVFDDNQYEACSSGIHGLATRAAAESFRI